MCRSKVVGIVSDQLCLCVAAILRAIESNFLGGGSLLWIQVFCQPESEQMNVTGHLSHSVAVVSFYYFCHFVVVMPFLFLYALSLFIMCGGDIVGLLCFARELCNAIISRAFCYSRCILVLYQSWWPCSIGGRDEWKPLAVFQVTLCFPWYHINLVLGFLHLYNTKCVLFFYTMACYCFSFSAECRRCSSVLSLFSSELGELDHTSCL